MKENCRKEAKRKGIVLLWGKLIINNMNDNYNNDIVFIFLYFIMFI